MKKVYLIAHGSLRSQILDTLQKQGLLHISDLREKVGEETTAPELKIEESLAEYESDLRETELVLDKIKFVLDFISEFEEKKKGFLAGLIKEKVKVSLEEFAGIQKKLDFETLYHQASDLDVELTHIKNRTNQLSLTRQSLEPWRELPISLSEVGETAKTVVAIGAIPTENFSNLKTELFEEVKESIIEPISQDFQNANFLIIFHKDCFEEAYRILYEYGFHPVSFPNLKGTPKEEIRHLDEEISELEKKREQIVNEIKKLLYLKPDLVVLNEFLKNKLEKIRIQERFAETKQVFMLEGWVPEEKEKDFKKSVEAISNEIDLSVVSPSEGEKPPVVLKNKSVFQPFEILTKLYGLPDYNELDPTPFMAPFFIFFFGICLGDFGYGLVLALASWWLGKTLEVGETTKRFFRLFIYGGISSMIVGVFTGSYFAIPVEALPGFLKALVIMDPMKDVQTFLVASIAFGVVHVCFGVCLAAANNIRNSKIMDAVFDQLSTLIFLGSTLTWLVCWLLIIITPTPPAAIAKLYPLAVKALGYSTLLLLVFQGRILMSYISVFSGMISNFKQGKLFEALRNQGLAFLALVGVILWVIKQGSAGGSTIIWIVAALLIVGLIVSKSTRSVLIGLGKGLFALYGMSSFIGDFLSYIRLMALGLSSVLIGGVVNTLGMILLGIPYLGVILMVVVLCGMHIFNLVINLLGAFVHSLRLQYVEFFKYFYSGGGQKFEPLAIQTKYLIFK